MIRRVRRFAARPHRDETGPDTVEWALLIIMALIILLLILGFAQFVHETFQQDAVEIQDDGVLDLDTQ